MRKLFFVCFVFGATATFAQTGKTSLVQAGFVSNAMVTSSSVTEQVTLSGAFQALVQVNSTTSPATSPSSILIGYSASASGVGQTTGTTYQVFSLSYTQGKLTLPGSFAWTVILRYTSPISATASPATNIKAVVNIDAQGNATLLSAAPSGLVSWWKAEGNAADVMGLNSGTLGEVVGFLPGQVGQAFSFGGQGYVEVAPSSSLQTGKVSALAWVRHLGVPGHDNYVLAQGGQGCVAASYALYTGLGNLTFYISDGSTYIESPDSGPGVWDGNWHLVAGTYDGQSVRLYVDGIQAGTETPSTLGINYGLQYEQFNIGAYRGTCELRFNGDIDEVQIFNRALSAAEIAGAFNSLTATVPIAGNGLQTVTQSDLQAAIDAGTAQPISTQIIEQQVQAQAATDIANETLVDTYLQANPQLTSLAQLLAVEPQPSPTVVPAGGSWKVLVPSLGTSVMTMGRSRKLEAMADTIRKSTDPAIQLNIYTNLYNSLPAAYLQSFTTDLGLFLNPPVPPASLANASLDQITQALARLAGDWKNIALYTTGNLPPLGDVPCGSEIGAGGFVGDIGDENGPTLACSSALSGNSFSPSGIMANFEFPLKHAQTCIKWQWNRNSCYIFADISAMEMMIADSSGWKVNLSEQDFMEHDRLLWYPRFPDDGGNAGNSVYAAIQYGYSFPYENKWIYNPSYYRTATTETMIVPLHNPPDVSFDVAYQHSCQYYSWWCSDSSAQAPGMCTDPRTYPTGCAFYDPGVPGSGYKVTSTDDFWHYENLDLSMTVMLLELVVHHGVVVGLEITPNFQSPGTRRQFLVLNRGFVNYDPADTATHVGGHVVHVVGFISDQDLHAKLPNAPSTANGWFIVKNSWSQCWGDSGYGYIAWDYIKNQANGAFAIRGVSY